MQGRFEEVGKRIYAGIFPKIDVSKGLEYIGKCMPEGEKMVLVVDSRDTAKTNGYTEIINNIEVDFTKERLFIIELIN